jgi:hypothetical protein
VCCLLSPSTTILRRRRLAQASHPAFATPLVRKAFAVARSAHDGQLRKSGEPVLVHAVQTARAPPTPTCPHSLPARPSGARAPPERSPPRRF